MATIKVTYKFGGSTTREASGFEGESCRTATAPYIRRQGGVVLSDTPTEDTGERTTHERVTDRLQQS